MTTDAQVTPVIEAQQEQKPATTPAVAQNTDIQSPEQTVPYTRFKEINDKLKAFEDDVAKQAKANQAAEEERLAKQSEWQTLADGRKAKLDEIEPAHAALVERKDKLEAVLSKQLEDELATWPDEVKALDPGKDTDLLARMEWANKSRALAAKLGAQPPTPGNGRRPNPVAQAGTGQTEQQARQQHERWGHSQF
jgi:vacuolar-type H+-ATPase subunit I/STV1